MDLSRWEVLWDRLVCFNLIESTTVMRAACLTPRRPDPSGPLYLPDLPGTSSGRQSDRPSHTGAVCYTFPLFQLVDLQ